MKLFKPENKDKFNFNIISNGVTIDGNIIFSGDIRINGKLNGNIECDDAVHLGYILV